MNSHHYGNEYDKMDISEKVTKLNDEDDEVVAEMDCYHIPLNRQLYSVATLQFMTEKPSRMEDCVARMKPIAKHLEIDYENGADRDDGIKRAESHVTFAGKGTSETEVLNHAICFVDDRKMYFVEVDDTYKMRRKATATTNADNDESTVSPVKRSLSPVRVKFAKAETDAQRKRREQSSYYKHQQAEQEVWKTLDIVHQNPKYALSLGSNSEEVQVISNGRVKTEPGF